MKSGTVSLDVGAEHVARSDPKVLSYALTYDVGACPYRRRDLTLRTRSARLRATL
jgi:hypothetical protein